MAADESSLRIRWSTLGLVWLVVAAISAVVLRWWQSTGGSLPLLSPLLAALLLALAILVAVLGWRIRRWVRRGERLDPLGATRTLALGQSAATAGAVLAGYLTASLGLAAMRLSAPEPRALAIASALALGAAIIMSIAGMVTQWCCRVPPDDQSRPDGDGGTPA